MTIQGMPRFVLGGVLCAATACAQEEPDARALYDTHCAQCHGADLQGGNAQSMLDGVWQFGEGRGYISRNIKNGITHLGMPAYESTLSDLEIRALAEWLVNAEDEAGVQKPPPPDQVQTLDYVVDVDVWVDGLDEPWGIAFPSDDTVLITEKRGTLRVVKDGALLDDAVSGTPEVLNEGQGGLLDVAVDPDYDDNGWVYLSYSHVLSGDDRRPGAMTRIVRGKIENNAWTGEEVIFEAPVATYKPTRHHYGTRTVFDPEGYLYFSIGDRGFQNDAQDVSLPNGKIHRIWPDGRIPEDNPFVKTENAIPSIYTFGNRNPQGLSVHPETGAVWETEHGPMGGDEVNVIRPGVNYGWPEITYGRNYTGAPVSDKVREEGMAQPTLYWKPSVAVCGIEFYDGDAFPLWQNKLLVGALKYEEVKLLSVTDDRVMHEEVILKNAGRVRDLGVGPDGAIYVVTEGPSQVLRLTPIAERTY